MTAAKTKTDAPSPVGCVSVLHEILIPIFRARWRWMVFGPFVIGVLTYLAGWLIQESYRSEARLIVVPPKYRETQTLLPERFSMKTYEEILQSPDLIKELLDRLRLANKAVKLIMEKHPEKDWGYSKKRKGFIADGYKFASTLDTAKMVEIVGCSLDEAETLLGRPATEMKPARKGLTPGDWIGASLFEEKALASTKLEEFMKSVKVKLTIEEDTPTMGVKYAPILMISADANSSKGARLKTKILADLFLDRASLITAENTKDSVDTINAAFIRAASEVWEAGSALRDYKSKNHLDLALKQIESLNRVLLGGSEQYLDPMTREVVSQPSALQELKQVERIIEKKRNTLTQIRKELDELTAPDGEWVGKIRPDHSPQQALQYLGDLITEASASNDHLLYSTLKSRESVWKAVADLESFEKRTNLESESARLSDETVNLKVLRQELQRVSAELKGYEEKFKKEQELQAKIKPTMLLKGEVPLEAIMPLLEKAGSAKDAKLLESLTINRETLTPEYTELGGQIVQTEGELASYAAKYQELQTLIAAKEKEIQELGVKVTTWREQKTNLESSLASVRSAHNDRFREFIKTQDLFQTTARELQRDIAIHEGLGQQVETFTDEIKKLMDDSERMKVDIDDLERRETSLKEAFALVSGNYKEAQMQRSSRVQDVRLVGEPEEPDLRTKPKRTMMAASASMMSFVLICAFVIIADRLRICPIVP